MTAHDPTAAPALRTLVVIPTYNELEALPGTLDRLAAFDAQALVPGRGEALTTPEKVKQGIDETRAFLKDVFEIAKAGVAAGRTLKQVYDQALAELRPKYGHWVIFDHCMPFDVSRAYDEAQGIDNPRIWTAQRDVEMWQALERAA